MIAKKRIIYTLSTIAVILLFINILVEPDVVETKPLVPIAQTVNPEEIIFRCVEDYGIKKEWIQKPKRQKKYNLIVDLPEEITIPDFISHINLHCIENEISMSAEELRVRGNSVVIISTDEKTNYKILLRNKEELVRDFATFEFFVNLNFNTESNEFQRLMYLPYSFNSMLYLTDDAELKKDILEKEERIYSVIINDEAMGKFELNEDYSKSKLIRAVKAIIFSFPKSTNFFIDKESEIYKSSGYNFVKDEFIKRNKKIEELSSLVILRGEKESDLESKFDFYWTSSKSKIKKVFRISDLDMLIISEKVKEFIREGNKISSS